MARLMVTVACANVLEARRIAGDLVEKRLAACVQIVPAVESIYRWEGKVETAQEALLLIKTSEARWEELVATVKALHSYEVPEILAMPIVQGSAEYCQWLDTQLLDAES